MDLLKHLVFEEKDEEDDAEEVTVEEENEDESTSAATESKNNQNITSAEYLDIADNIKSKTIPKDLCNDFMKANDLMDLEGGKYQSDDLPDGEWFAVEKYDGSHMFYSGKGKKLISRSGKVKQLPQSWHEKMPNFGFQCELIVWRGENRCRESVSCGTTVDEEKWKNQKLVVFDVPWMIGVPFSARYLWMNRASQDWPEFIVLAKNFGKVRDREHANEIMESVTAVNYNGGYGEGLMLYRADGVYERQSFRSSTKTKNKSTNILKHKPYIDGEFMVVNKPGGSLVYCKDPNGMVFKTTPGKWKGHRNPKKGDIITVHHMGLRLLTDGKYEYEWAKMIDFAPEERDWDWVCENWRIGSLAEEVDEEDAKEVAEEPESFESTGPPIQSDDDGVEVDKFMTSFMNTVYDDDDDDDDYDDENDEAEIRLSPSASRGGGGRRSTAGDFVAKDEIISLGENEISIQYTGQIKLVDKGYIVVESKVGNAGTHELIVRQYFADGRTMKIIKRTSCTPKKSSSGASKSGATPTNQRSSARSTGSTGSNKTPDNAPKTKRRYNPSPPKVQDTFKRWYDAKCEKAETCVNKGCIMAKLAFDSYKNWCDENDIPKNPKSRIGKYEWTDMMNLKGHPYCKHGKRNNHMKYLRFKL